jgi:hypothetical protein
MLKAFRMEPRKAYLFVCVSFWKGGQSFFGAFFHYNFTLQMCWNGKLTDGCREVCGCRMINSNLFLCLNQSQAEQKGRGVKNDLIATGKFFFHVTHECLLKSSERSKYALELNYTS